MSEKEGEIVPLGSATTIARPRFGLPPFGPATFGCRGAERRSVATPPIDRATLAALDAFQDLGVTSIHGQKITVGRVGRDDAPKLVAVLRPSARPESR